MPTVTIETSEKYRYVVAGERPPDSQTIPTSGNTPYDSARLGFEQASEPSATEDDKHDHDGAYEVLSWNHISVPKDPNLLGMMTTYFDGVEPTDPADLIRAKLRLCAVEHVTNAQIAAKAEMNSQTPTQL